MKVRSNRWQHFQLRGLGRLKAMIFRSSLVDKSNYFRNFEFSISFRDNLRELVFRKFGRENVVHVPQSRENKMNGVHIEDFEIKSHDLYIATNADLEEEPPWGYIGINKITDSNWGIAMELAREIDRFAYDYPDLD